MATPLEHSPRSGLGRLGLGALLFALVAPAPLFAFPLAVLLAASGRRWPEAFGAAVAGGLSAVWLLQTGALPDQVTRAALVIGTGVFAVLSLTTGLSLTHRALLAVAVAGLGIALMFTAAGWTWEELAWWVRSRVGYGTRLALGRMRALGGADGPLGDGLDAWIVGSADLAAACFPALVALQLMAGFGLATALYHRISAAPRGAPVGRLRDFRFSEHLGWAAAIPLLLLVVRVGGAKVAATNLLVVTGALYALRGVAVGAFGATLAGHGALAAGVAAAATLLMLPVMLGAAVILGVLDAGMNLRRRWTAPPTDS